MRVLFILFSSIIILGCSRTFYYTPDASTFQLHSINEFTSTSLISLINTQKSSDQVLFAVNSGHKFYSNLQEWTDVAIDITQRELTKREMTVTNNAPKQLKMSIENVTYTSVTILFTTGVDDIIVTLKVETGDGYVNTYKGVNTSPATIYRAADGAVMIAVAEMLRDEKIITYLEE